jgi:hypothetical protein
LASNSGGGGVPRLREFGTVYFTAALLKELLFEFILFMKLNIIDLNKINLKKLN